MKSIKNNLIELGIKFSESFTKGSSFLLSDGSYCNLNEQKEKFKGYVYHGQLDDFIINNKLLNESDISMVKKNNLIERRPEYLVIGNQRILRFTDNACTLNDGNHYNWENCYIDLPENMPKDKQLEQLILWIDNLHYNNSMKRKLDISLKNTVITFDIDKDATDDIIKEIKKLYRERDE